MSRDSSDDWGFDFRRWLGIFLLDTMSRPARGPTQPSIQWVLVALFLGVKRLWHEADYSSPSTAEVKECVVLCLHSPVRFHGMVLM